MKRTFEGILLAVLTVGATLMPVAAGSNVAQIPTLKWSYLSEAVEHDGQGSSFEPDGEPGNCVVDRTGDGRCEADDRLPGGQHSQLIVPGCYDDQGRQPSGLCGLYTIGAGDAAFQRAMGIAGMEGEDAPGRTTPTKSSTIGLFDLQLRSYASLGTAVELNHKASDSGAQHLLRPLIGTERNAWGPSLLWLWFGTWTDRNGNGVIDEHGDDVGGIDKNRNEFVWFGDACTGRVAQQGGCVRIPGLRVHLWIWTDRQAAPLQPTHVLNDATGAWNIQERLWYNLDTFSPLTQEGENPAKILYMRARGVDAAGQRLFEDVDRYVLLDPPYS